MKKSRVQKKTKKQIKEYDKKQNKNLKIHHSRMREGKRYSNKPIRKMNKIKLKKKVESVKI